MNEITISFSLSNLFSYAMAGFLAILATKFLLAILTLVLRPKGDGQSFWEAAAVLLNLSTLWPLSLLAAGVVSLLACFFAWKLVTVLIICAALAVFSAGGHLLSRGR